jgi:hypothetical protein
MANQITIQSLSQLATMEEYYRRLLLFLFQPIISHLNDIFETRFRKRFHQFLIRTDGAGPESIGLPVDF